MARRKRKEEEPGWTAPEFDEVEFMRKDIAGAKAAVITVGWAIVGALLAFGALVVGVPPVAAFFIGLFAAGGLYFVLPLFGVRAEKFQRRDWFGHGSTYFFSWLAFWILLLNQPLGDFTNPTIHSIAVGVYDPLSNPDPNPATVDCVAAGGTRALVTADPGETNLFVLFRATDNVGVPKQTLEVRWGPPTTLIDWTTIESVDGARHACSSLPNRTYPAGSFVVKFPIVRSLPTTFNIDIIARDVGGRTAHVNFDIEVR